MKYVIGGGLRARPLVEHGDPEDDRHEQQNHYRQRSDRSGKQSPDKEAPRTAHDVVQHVDAKRADGYADPEDEREQPRAKELLSVEEDADDTREDADRVDDQRSLLESREPCEERIAVLHLFSARL